MKGVSFNNINLTLNKCRKNKMNVKELIEELQKHDLEAPVVLESKEKMDWGYLEVDKPRKIPLCEPEVSDMFLYQSDDIDDPKIIKYGVELSPDFTKYK